jgi:preprotein translocase subunit SecG
MTTFLTTLHVTVCIVLIAVVLLQRGKGSDMGAALGGGGSNTVFGSRGAGNFLTKMTTVCAIIFMTTSLSLAYLTTQDENQRIFDSELQANPTDGQPASTNPSAAADDSGVSSGTLEEIPQPQTGGSAEPEPQKDSSKTAPATP